MASRLRGAGSVSGWLVGSVAAFGRLSTLRGPPPVGHAGRTDHRSADPEDQLATPGGARLPRRGDCFRRRADHLLQVGGGHPRSAGRPDAGDDLCCGIYFWDHRLV